MNNESSDIRNLVVEIRKDILTLVKTDHYDESWRVLEFIWMRWKTLRQRCPARL